MYLSRLTLSRAPDMAALAQLMNPDHEGRRMDAHHRLIWSAFAGDPAARRDFLWREMGHGAFLVLSPRAPQETSVFEASDKSDFAPELRPGDRLSFLLRANATRSVTGTDNRKRHHDVVMEALGPVSRADRAEARMDVAQAAGADWLKGQGARAGFEVLQSTVSTYRVLELRRNGPRFGVLDIEGLLTVTDPAAFLARLRQGFGRAKAFGCGLMLIRRV